MSRFSFLLAGAIGLVLCAHCGGSSFEFADASVDGLAGSGSGAGSGTSSSGGGTGSGSGGSSGARGGSSSSASSGAGSGSGGGHGSSAGSSSGSGGGSSGAGSGGGSGSGSGSGSGGASSASSSGSSSGTGSGSGGPIDGGGTCLSNGCDAGTTCCGLSCCAAGQLCCAFSGPVPPVDPYYCLTPTASQRTCPVGCSNPPRCVSDRTVKRDIEPVDERAVLEGVSQLPISTWSYRADSRSVRHLGPMAQDFFAEFGLGDSDRSYDPIDAHGVALAAIKALHDQLREQNARIEALERENQELRAPAVCR